MAQRLHQFPGEPGDGQRRYPWAEWTDGSVWEVRRGEDYDVATENMRVNLHMKADALGQKVKTKKIAGGEGLVFQFLPSEDQEVVQMQMQRDPERTKAALDRLYADAMDIYERARQEVTIERKDGRRQK